jgi:hypothetical protein
MRLRQVTLTRPSQDGQLFEVCWIDDSLAKVGRRILGDDEIIWKVSEIYGTRDSTEVEKQYLSWKQFDEVLK